MLEYKSPLDRLTLSDFDLLRVYRLLVKRKYRLRRDAEIWAISLTSQFERGYREYVGGNGYQFKEIEPGVFGHEDDRDRFYWLDLSIIGQRYPENFINFFSSNYRRYEQSVRIGEKEAGILTYVWQSIFFKEELAKMRHEKLRHLPEFTASMEEIRKRLFEEVLSQLKPEEVLSRFRPEERLSGLRPEDVLAAMSKSQREKLKKLLESQS